MEIGLSLGSNLGARLKHLQAAKQKIKSLKSVSFAAQSPVYETEPVDVAPEDRARLFLNAVIIVKSALAITELAARFQAIEQALGRKAGRRLNAPRIIDIDIIYAGDLRLKGGGIIIPHPRWSRRRFVVQPLADLRPELVVPGQACPVAEILKTLADKHALSLFARQW